jgi:hypothetical protein
MRRAIALVVIGVELVSTLACATTTMTPARDVSHLRTYSSARVMTAADLREYSPTMNLEDAILLGRTNMLRGNYARSRVFIDGYLGGDVSILRTLSISAVREVRLLTETEAAMRYGTMRGRGPVIDVTLMRR